MRSTMTGPADEKPWSETVRALRAQARATGDMELELATLERAVALAYAEGYALGLDAGRGRGLDAQPPPPDVTHLELEGPDGRPARELVAALGGCPLLAGLDGAADAAAGSPLAAALGCPADDGPALAALLGRSRPSPAVAAAVAGDMRRAADAVEARARRSTPPPDRP